MGGISYENRPQIEREKERERERERERESKVGKKLGVILVPCSSSQKKKSVQKKFKLN